jgi:sec-independent protein translocase protein TatC
VAESSDEKRMTFIEHLDELRTRIIRSVIALVIGVIMCYALSNYILQFLTHPLAPLLLKAQLAAQQAAAHPGQTLPSVPLPRMMLLSPFEIVFVQIKISAYGGIILSLPFIIFQLCAFIFPGLKPLEQRIIKVLLFGCSGLAVLGISVAYFTVLPLIMPLILRLVPEGWEVQMRASETISQIVVVLGGFAIAFQFPMFVLIAVYLGLLQPATLRKHRRVAIVGIAIASMLLAPPDVVSMLIMMVPLYILYEASIWLSYFVVKKRDAAAAANSG